jgi:hypothetical protein
MGAKQAVARRNEALELLELLEGSGEQGSVQPFAARFKSRRASMLSESLVTGIQHMLDDEEKSSHEKDGKDEHKEEGAKEELATRRQEIAALNRRLTSADSASLADLESAC